VTLNKEKIIPVCTTMNEKRKTLYPSISNPNKLINIENFKNKNAQVL
jgi:hypothetical protein